MELQRLVALHRTGAGRAAPSSLANGAPGAGPCLLRGPRHPDPVGGTRNWRQTSGNAGSAYRREPVNPGRRPAADTPAPRGMIGRTVGRRQVEAGGEDCDDRSVCRAGGCSAVAGPGMGGGAASRVRRRATHAVGPAGAGWRMGQRHPNAAGTSGTVRRAGIPEGRRGRGAAAAVVLGPARTAHGRRERAGRRRRRGVGRGRAAEPTHVARHGADRPDPAVHTGERRSAWPTASTSSSPSGPTPTRIGATASAACASSAADRR